MRKRRVYFILGVVSVVLAGVLVAVFRREREPEYGGKRLSKWVKGYSPTYAFMSESAQKPTAEEAANAIRHIGTNALPYLLECIQYEPPPWKAKLWTVTDKLFRRSPGTSWLSDKRILRAESACYALIGLGPDVEGVVEGLTKVLNDPNALSSEARAAAALVSLGKAGLPPLLSVLTNQQSTARQKYVVALDIGTLGTNGTSAVPALRLLVSDPDINVRTIATNVLGKLDPQALER